MTSNTLIWISKIWLILLIISALGTISIEPLWSLAAAIIMIVFIYALSDQKVKLAQAIYWIALLYYVLLIIYLVRIQPPSLTISDSPLLTGILFGIEFTIAIAPFWVGLRGLKRLFPEEPKSNRDIVHAKSKNGESEKVVIAHDTVANSNCNGIAPTNDLLKVAIPLACTQSTPAKLKTCTNCDTTIGRLEQSHVFKNSVVCASCYERLKKQEFI